VPLVARLSNQGSGLSRDDVFPEHEADHAVGHDRVLVLAAVQVHRSTEFPRTEPVLDHGESPARSVAGDHEAGADATQPMECSLTLGDNAAGRLGHADSMAVV